MNLLETLLQAQSGDSVRQVAGRFGIDESQASSAISALLPALAGGLQNNVAQEGGLESLLGALGSGRHQRYIDDPSALTGQDTIAEGNGILGHILGSKDVSRQVAQQAAEQTGLGPTLMKQMLPVVATIVMGALSKQSAQASAPSEGVMGMLAPMLDRNRDGSVADDVLGMVGKLFR